MDSDKFIKSFLQLIVGVGNFLLEPWVATKVWGWFLVPWGLPALTWPAAYGINLVINLWIGPPHNVSYKGDKLLDRTVTVFAFTLVILTFGWFVFTVLK